MKKIISVLSLSLIVSLIWMSGNLFAYKESDLKKLKDTNKCRKYDLSKSNLKGVNLTGSNLAMANLSESNLTGGKKSLCLDIYHNQRRHYEFLSLYLLNDNHGKT
jgi:uncharacterized protein YjbI with pentapeptide repeats